MPAGQPGSVGRVSQPPSSAAGPTPAYPGQRLGLPEHGPGSVAGWGRRFAALAVDWVASSLAAVALFGYEWFGDTVGQQGWVGFSPWLVFVVERALFTAFMGGSFGQLLVRVSVVRLDGRPVDVLRALGRSVLILLVVPPLVFNSDRRGLHDLAVGTVVLQR